MDILQTIGKWWKSLAGDNTGPSQPTEKLKCRATNFMGAKVCVRCGACMFDDKTRYCQHCGAAMPVHGDVCERCGHEQGE